MNTVAKDSTTGKKFDLYQEVTDQVIAALESGNLKQWEQDWQRIGLYPTNYDTKARYKGVNILILGFVAAAMKYSSNRWLTFKQAQKMGGRVKKGEKATRAMFYKPLDQKDAGQIVDNTKPRMVLSYFGLFNMDQIEGINVTADYVPVQHEPSTHYDELIKMADGMGVNVQHLSQNNAFYKLGSSDVVMPLLNQFNSMAGCNATLAHELIHATGSLDRTNRHEKLLKATAEDFKAEYAFEELVAELGSTFLTVHLGIDYAIENHISYLDSWLSALRKDKKLIFKAARLAQNAVEFMLPVVAVQDIQDTDNVIAVAS